MLIAPRLLLAGVVVASCLVIGGLGDAAGPSERGVPPLEDPDYVGKLIGEPGGRVFIDVEPDRGPAQTVLFQPRDYGVVCESERQTATAFIGSQGLGRRGDFTALEAQGGDQSPDVSFSIAQGKLSGRTVHGYFFSMADPSDPSGSGEENVDECWSDGKVRWRARRIDDDIQTRHAPPPRLPTALRDHAAPRAERRPSRYDGNLTSIRQSRVKLRVDEDTVRLDVRLKLDCDGPDRVASLAPLRMPLAGDRFMRAVFTQARGSRDREFYWVEGRLRPGGRATGSLAYFEDPWDPPRTRNEAECGTTPLSGWSATQR